MQQAMLHVDKQVTHHVLTMRHSTCNKKRDVHCAIFSTKCVKHAATPSFSSSDSVALCSPHTARITPVAATNSLVGGDSGSRYASPTATARRRSESLRIIELDCGRMSLNSLAVRTSGELGCAAAAAAGAQKLPLTAQTVCCNRAALLSAVCS